MNKEQKKFAEEIKEELIKLQSISDKEKAHIEADQEICQLLCKLGFKDIAEAYEKIDKWYC